MCASICFASPFDLETFTFNGHTLLTIMIDGAPWFASADVMTALGRSRFSGSHVHSSTDPSERQTLIFRDFERLHGLREIIFPKGAAGQRPPKTSLVSESGLYKVIMRAQRVNPAAASFQTWVTKEVLPRIRKNGGYIKDDEKVATGDCKNPAAPSVPPQSP